MSLETRARRRARCMNTGPTQYTMPLNYDCQKSRLFAIQRPTNIGREICSWWERCGMATSRMYMLVPVTSATQTTDRHTNGRYMYIQILTGRYSSAVQGSTQPRVIAETTYFPSYLPAPERRWSGIPRYRQPTRELWLRPCKVHYIYMYSLSA